MLYYELNLFGDPELRLRVTEESSCTEEDIHLTPCGTGVYASTGIETCNNIDDGGDGSIYEPECVAEPENSLLPANGEVLESFTSEHGSGFVASDSTNEGTDEVDWSSAVDPGPQEIVYSFLDGKNAAAKNVKPVFRNGYRGGFWELGEFEAHKEVISCTDVDGDTYSPEGGDCGAVDCNMD